MLAAIFHDIGKTVDRANHEFAGAQIALDMWPRLPMVAYLILHHSQRWGPCCEPRIAWMVQHDIIHLDDQRARWLADLLSVADYTSAFANKIF